MKRECSGLFPIRYAPFNPFGYRRYCNLTGKCPASPALEVESRGPMGREAQWVEEPNGSRDTMKNDISLARILLAIACPGSPAPWVGNFT